ncbi:hypothetical protein [Roseibium sp. M-1]
MFGFPGKLPIQVFTQVLTSDGTLGRSCVRQWALLFLAACWPVQVHGAGGPVFEPVSQLQAPELQIACGPLPDEFRDSAGRRLGRTDYLNTVQDLFAGIGVSARLVSVPWERAKVGLKDGLYQGLCACSKARAIENGLHFSDRLAQASVRILTSEKGFTKVKAFPQRKLLVAGLAVGAVLQDTAFVERMELIGADYILPLDSNESAMKMLHLGRLDAVIAYGSGFESPELQGIKARSLFLQEVWRDDFHVCLSKAAGIADMSFFENFSLRKAADMRGDWQQKSLR